ncbi:uncharacterized protein RCC_07485 [Ramularia collo-cygni]|uniref:SAC3/GANP/THP3 conserved domain-containing protein n=1 Tax=Ramularia collo-cygni TaxID=112498 RepID=A0A2D3UXP0_9PEZI|nr:uncharacterized protein RCC_07485 [Ramularia collo-cygni]CZT21621.1 uncharacterized protein RCC_07485 [Ramularia collo-cygni]
MSFPSRGRGRGSSRGNRPAASPRGAPSRSSNPNGNVPSGPARGGFGSSRGTFGAATRGSGAQVPRGGRGGSTSRGNAFIKPPSRRAANGGAMAGGLLKDRYEQLKKIRELERKDAERQGIVSAPGQARLLSDAVTPVGTCLDMCAEWERVERAYQNSVAPEELDPDHSAYAPGGPLPVEARMVKKFKRPGAGDGDQLPSDLRPPHVLRTTCDYLFRDLLANAPSLASVHGFIWDRTRAIRNDFSIQQVTKLDDVRIAIECFERIARFHILALHQMATPESQQAARRAETTYEPQQEREQLDRTLLSLMQYYDDYRGRLELTNEAEFRSYCVIFQLDSSQTDTEDRVQTWPKALLGDRKIQAALSLFAAACSTFRRLGPFKALATEHVIARQDWEGFWKVMNSSKISYLQACVAEIYFHLLRDVVLRSIIRAMRPMKPVNGKLGPNTEWSMHDLRDLFYFDDDEQLIAFCALYDLEFYQVGDEDYLDVSSVAGKTLQTPTFGKSIQESSWIVEQKRLGRSWAAVIDGMNVQQARNAGMIHENGENEDMTNAAEEQETGGSGEDDPESLFIPENQNTSGTTVQEPKNATPAGFMSSSPFGQTSNASGTMFGQLKPSTFGQPSGELSLSKPSAFGQPTPPVTSFGQAKPTVTSEKKPTFSFLGPSVTGSGVEPKAAVAGTSPFSTPGSLFGLAGSSPTTAFPDKTLDKPAAQPSTSPFGQPAASLAPSLFAPKQESGNVAASSNPFMATTSTNPFLAPSAPVTSQEKLPAPSFSFSKPEQTQAQTVPSLFGDLSAPASTPAALSDPAPEEMNSKSTTASTPFAAPLQPPSTLTTHGGQDTNTGSQSPPRRSSINNLPDTKPKKPSPLSHSFTFSDESGSHAGASLIGHATTKQPTVEDLFPGREKTALPPSFTQTKPAAQSPINIQPAAPSFDALLARLSEELTTDPVSGFLKQYVDYTVKQVITKVQEDLYWERMNAEADEFRSWFLQDKYGKRWRDTCRRQRLAKQGRERRKRAQKRLHESRNGESLSFEEIRGAASSLRSSKASSVASHQSRRDMVDAMYKSTLGSSRFPNDRQAQAGSKRSVSSQGPDSAMGSTENGHKRMKSTSHVDDHGRVPQSSGIARSSFLNFALPTDAPNRSSTTKSPYFRMKALGVKPSTYGDTGTRQGTKRPRSESFDTEQRSQSSTSLLRASSDQLRERNDGLMRPPSTRSVRSKADDEDEALFARLKAAREGLRESGSFLRNEVEKESELRRSASSLSDRESPSLARARAEIRLQTSQADSDFGASLSDREVPAYRLRESRFVPREQYGRARERASEIIASRSQRAESFMWQADRLGFDHSAEDNIGADALSDAIEPSFNSQPNMPNGVNGISGASSFLSKAAPADDLLGINDAHFNGFDGSGFGSNTPFFPQASLPAPPITSGAPVPFLEDSLTQDSSNPFLQAPVSNSPFISQSGDVSQHAYQPSQALAFDAATNSMTYDNTIQQSQIEGALSRSFVQPSQDGPSSFAPPSLASQPSQTASKAVPSVSDDEYEDQAKNDEPNMLDNGMNVEVGDGDGDDSQSDTAVQFKPKTSANRFAMLAENDEENESQEGGFAGELSSDDEQTEAQPDSYQYDDGANGEYDSENGEEFESDQGQGQARDTGAGESNAGFYSEEEGDDAEDEMEYDSEEGSWDEDDDDGPGFVPQVASRYLQPQPNEALQVVGHNEDDAIELSD